MRVRRPKSADLNDTLGDMLSLECAPPMLVSASLVVLLTGSLLTAAAAAGLSTFALAFWQRLCDTD